MWLTPTRGRADSILKMLDCMKATGEVPDVAVMVDFDEHQHQYRSINWPKNWRIHYADRHLELTGAVNTLLAEYPNDPWYGVLCDHARPKAANWSSLLVREAAGGYANSALIYEPKKNPRSGLSRMRYGVFDGRIIRAAGFMLPPEFIHFWGDDVWEGVLHGLGLWRQTDVFVNNAKQNPDADGDHVRKHARMWNGVDIHAHDKKAWSKWCAEGKSAALAKKVAEAMKPC